MHRRRIWIWVLILTILALLVGIGLLAFQMKYVYLEETVYPRDLETLSFSTWPIPEQSRLTRFSKLKQLDLLQADISIDQYDEVSRLLPDCEILWSVPFQQQRLPLDTEKLTLTSFTDEDIIALQHLPNLKAVTVIDFGEPEDIDMLKKQLPDCRILRRQTIGGTLVDQYTTYFVSSNIKDITLALSEFPNITLIDATGCPFYGALSDLRQQYPKCRFIYEVPIGGIYWSGRSNEIVVDSTSVYELSLTLPALPRVKSVTINDPISDLDGMLQLREDYPNIQFTYSFDLYGQVVTTDTESVNLSWVQIGSGAAIDRYLPHFNNLKRAELRRCGIPNEEMDALKQKYPNTFFIWEVKIGHAWIRTDVTYFMPYKHRLVLYDQHVDNLKYLTELICLDMGHMKVTRTDYLAYMPKLQYLLMCSTPITDISHCANMKDLKYVELFITKVTDFSPLLECKNLVDLNVSYTYPEDPLIFGQMKQLKNLWFRNMRDWNVRNQLQQALPNTKMVFDPGSSTGGGWRKLPNYYAQRDIVHMPYMEED